jgi:cytochrome c553
MPTNPLIAPPVPTKNTMQRIYSFIAFLALGSLAASASAGDLAAGHKKSAPCTVCHGANGISVMIEAPNLAGQQPVYLTEQLRNYRSGRRGHEVMGVMAKPLSDTDIEDLAAWYAAIQVQVTLPP